MTKRILFLFSILFLIAGCGAITARDSAGPEARIQKPDRVIAETGGASADGKGAEQKKDVK